MKQQCPSCKICSAYHVYSKYYFLVKSFHPQKNTWPIFVLMVFDRVSVRAAPMIWYFFFALACWIWILSNMCAAQNMKIWQNAARMQSFLAAYFDRWIVSLICCLSSAEDWHETYREIVSKSRDVPRLLLVSHVQCTENVPRLRSALPKQMPAKSLGAKLCYLTEAWPITAVLCMAHGWH